VRRWSREYRVAFAFALAGSTARRAVAGPSPQMQPARRTSAVAPGLGRRARDPPRLATVHRAPLAVSVFPVPPATSELSPARALTLDSRELL